MSITKAQANELKTMIVRYGVTCGSYPGEFDEMRKTYAYIDSLTAEQPQEPEHAPNSKPPEGLMAWYESDPAREDVPLKDDIIAIREAIAQKPHGGAAIERWMRVLNSHRVQKVLDRLDAVEKERDALLVFAGQILLSSTHGEEDTGGDTVQRAALDAGLVEGTTAYEACAEDCRCAEVSNFPVTCLRSTEAGKRATDSVLDRKP